MYQLKLIGYPIEHSLSPWIHRQLLEKAGLNGNYQLFEITPEDDFELRLQELKQADVAGFNITVPYKQKIIPYLDELDSVAEEMQAVNTVAYRDGKWSGFNTDGAGYLRSLETAYPDFSESLDKRILILGAGGAARAVYYALHARGFTNIDLANRTLEKAEDIAKMGNANSKTAILNLHEAEKNLLHYDLIIHTTSVGMKHMNPEPLISIKELKPEAIVSDIVYQPIKTQLLLEAEKHQARLLYGHAMLLYQAQAAFEIWTKQRIDVSQMEKDLLEILEGR